MKLTKQGSAIVEVTVLSGVVLTFGFALVSTMISQNLQIKRENTFTDWNQLINTMRFVYTNPYTCQAMFKNYSGLPTGGAPLPGSLPLRCIGTTSTNGGVTSCSNPFLQTNQVSHNIYSTLIELRPPTTGESGFLVYDPLTKQPAYRYKAYLNLKAKRYVDSILQHLAITSIGDTLVSRSDSFDPPPIQFMLHIDSTGALQSCYSYDDSTIPAGTTIAIDPRTSPGSVPNTAKCPGGWANTINDSSVSLGSEVAGIGMSGRTLLGAGTSNRGTAATPMTAGRVIGDINNPNYAYTGTTYATSSTGGAPVPSSVPAMQYIGTAYGGAEQVSLDLKETPPHFHLFPYKYSKAHSSYAFIPSITPGPPFVFGPYCDSITQGFGIFSVTYPPNARRGGAEWNNINGTSEVNLSVTPRGAVPTPPPPSTASFSHPIMPPYQVIEWCVKQ